MKRRRLNPPPSAISKPFKSPLLTKSPQTTKAAQDEIDSAASNAVTASPLPPAPARDPQLTSFPPHPSAAAIQPSSKSSSPEQALLAGSTVSPLPPHASEDSDTVIALQKRSSSLSMQLSRVKQQLDTAEQAVKVLKSDQDDELQALIAKWRRVSQQAADEVFRGARVKIGDMGGLRAWRQQSKRNVQSWEVEPGWGLNQDQSTQDEAEDAVESMRYELAGETRKYGAIEEEESLSDGDDDFTMDKMLRSMNVSLDLIGYDQENQGWLDPDKS